MSLSVSSVTAYNNCPYSYYLDKIKKLPGKKGEALIKGSEIHEIFDKSYIIAKQNLKKKEIEETPENVIKELKELEPTVKLDHKEQYQNFINLNEKIMSIPLYQEQKLYDKELDFVGVLDRVDFQKGKLIIMDYKTGKSKPIEEHRFQLAMYAYLFIQLHNQEPTHWAIYFSKTNELLIEPISKPAIINAVEHVKQTRKRIEEDIKRDCFNRNRNWMCKWCQYYEICEQGNIYIKKKIYKSKKHLLINKKSKKEF